MQLETTIRGGVYMLADHYRYDQNHSLQRSSSLDLKNGHYYYCIGSAQNTPRSLSYSQVLLITSLANNDPTCEIPVVVNGTVSFIVPYAIYNYTSSEFDGVFKGMLGGEMETNEFIEGLMAIYMDKVVYNGRNKEVYEMARKFHDDYVIQFYEDNKGRSLFANNNQSYVPIGYDGTGIDPSKKEKEEKREEIQPVQLPPQPIESSALKNTVATEIAQLENEIFNNRVDTTGDPEVDFPKRQVVAVIPQRDDILPRNPYLTSASKFDVFLIDGKVIKKKSNDELRELKQFLYSDDPQIKNLKKQVYNIRSKVRREMEKRNLRY